MAQAKSDFEIEAAVASALAEPYRRELVPNDDGTWFGRIVELPGCMSEGDTALEALSNLEDAMRGWLRVQIEDGDIIPPPAANTKYSGKFMVRVSPRLHRDLAAASATEGVSLNAFIATALARYVGETAMQVAIESAARLNFISHSATGSIANSAHLLDSVARSTDDIVATTVGLEEWASGIGAALSSAIANAPDIGSIHPDIYSLSAFADYPTTRQTRQFNLLVKDPVRHNT